MRWCGCDHSGFESCMPGESECWLSLYAWLCPLLEAWHWSAVVSSLFVDLQKKKEIIIKDMLVLFVLFLFVCFVFLFIFAKRLKRISFWRRDSDKSAQYSHLQKFQTRHDFQAFYAMTSDYLISCFYCIIQFGLKKNVRKERGNLREPVRETKKYKKPKTIKKQTQKN